jgi:phage gp36-like protein
VASIYVSNATFFAKCIPALANAGATIVTDAGIDASGEADGYLSKRFALPLIAPFDTGLCLKVFDMMQWAVATQVGFRPASGQNEVLHDKYEKALEWLANVSRGIVELPLQIDSTPSVDEEGPIAMSDPPMSFRNVTGRGRHW